MIIDLFRVFMRNKKNLLLLEFTRENRGKTPWKNGEQGLLREREESSREIVYYFDFLH